MGNRGKSGNIIWPFTSTEFIRRITQPDANGSRFLYSCAGMHYLRKSLFVTHNMKIFRRQDSQQPDQIGPARSESEYQAEFNDSDLKPLIHATRNARRPYVEIDRKTHAAATVIYLYRRSNIKRSELTRATRN